MFRTKLNYEDMKNPTYNYGEGTAYPTLLESRETDFTTQFVGLLPPDDDDEEDEEGEGVEESENETHDDDNPPIDKDVVHSPVPTQSGGKPKN